MMMSAEVCVEPNPPPPDTGRDVTRGVIRLASFSEARGLTIRFIAGRASVKAMSMRMLQFEQDRSGEAVDLAHSSLAEVLNIIAGRLNNSLDEEGREFVIGFPAVEERSSGDGEDDSQEAMRIDFTAAETIHFTISISLGYLPKSRVAVSGLSEGMVLAETVDLPSGSKLARGCRLTREHIGNIEKGRLEEIEVFDAF